ncbi:AAA family ATPase, partial [Mycobacterium tuberculosis]|nr:AAA family ATPase [Mycobacterium tuberculosis]
KLTLLPAGTSSSRSTELLASAAMDALLEELATTAVPGEGKTQTAINLAVSIAMELDHTVLLVEADVIRPSALDRMGVSVSKGLLDLLTAPQTDLSEVLLKTNIPKLTLLPAGTSSSRSTELLASAAMDALLEELATT